MKKSISLVIMAALLMGTLAGCNSGDSSTSSAASPAGDAAVSASESAPAEGAVSAGKTLNWLSQGTTWEELTKDILTKYEADTGIAVKGEFYSFKDLFEVIEVKIASGSADYDVISVDVPMVAAYATRGYLSPMDEYFTAEEKAGFIPSAVDAGSWDGVFYAPPMNTSSQLLWYNKDLLEQAGVTVRESTVDNRLTWDELVTMATATLDKVDPDRNQGIAGINFQQVSRTYQMCAVPNSMGEAAIGPDGYTVDGVINSDGWVKALTWYQDLYNNNIALRGVTADESTDQFMAGKVVFMIGGTWTAAQCDAAGTNYGYAPCPAFAGFEDKVATPTGSWHFGINKASANQTESAAFIKWFSLGEGNTLWLDVNKDVPSTMAAVEAIGASTEAPEYLKIAAYEAANTAVPRALTPGYTEYSTVMDTMFEDVRNGTDVKTALDSAVTQIDTAFAKYK